MPSRHLPDDADFHQIVDAVREHTHSLLGLTITFSNEEWAAPSRLPGWTRSHVAAHIAADARGLTRVCEALAESRSEKMYDSDLDKTLEIERGSLASGVELQIRLDETAGLLDRCWAQVANETRDVTLRAGYRIPARLLPMARLYELVLHTFDLKPDAPALQVSPEVSPFLLQFGADQIGESPVLPAITLIADEGVETRVGAGDSPVTVTGSSAALLAWLTRGVRSENLEGAFEIDVNGLAVH